MQSRIKYSFKLASVHLTISITIACLVAFAVFKCLYPWPFSSVLGVTHIFIILISIDVICGPILTFFVANPKKSNTETTIDLTIIGCIQITALLFGLNTIYQARPVANIFEQDRFVLVQANEVQTQLFQEALSSFQSLPTTGILTLATREPRDIDEKLESLDLSLEGIEPSLRPNWWINFDQTQRKKALQRSGSIKNLIQKHPEKKSMIVKSIKKLGIKQENVRFLPFVSLKALDWVVLLDKDANILGYLHLDAFKEAKQNAKVSVK